MIAVLLLVSLAGAVQSEKEVTAAEKAAFFELLAKLETKGEFFTEESVKKMLPHARVLFALTSKDLQDYDIYAFLALSSQLAEHKELRAIAAKQFDKIAHPLLQLLWAAKLFDVGEATPEVVKYLKRVVASEKASKVLDEVVGPKSEEFKKRVKEAKVKEK